ncbi:uncharacterized protein LOC135132240 isoform X2 [Zophobas morio]|uniref:uncharacterized protein LOC135132240 isoform X2 n=1 Tax=Zophobas morio TaxID=2755281 RepID=UPI003082C405
MSKRYITLTSLLVLVHSLKRQTPCDDSWTMNCPIELNETGTPFYLYRFKTNRIVIKFSTKCDFDNVKYSWKFYSERTKKEFYHNDNTSVKVVQPYEWDNGEYAISVEVSLQRNGLLIPDFIGCVLEMVSLDPIPVIKGGSYRMIEPGTVLVLDSSGSIDRDVPPHVRGTIMAKWSCRLSTGSGVTSCLDDEEGEIVTLKPDSVVNNEYLFILKIRTKSNPKWVSTNQTVVVQEGVTPLEIVCVKNCPPAAPTTDSTRGTFLRVRCLNNCDDIEESSYEWTVDGDFDYEKMTQFGRNTDKFVIKENVFEYGNDYVVSVKLVDRPGMAKKTLQLPRPIKIDSCKVTPPEGTALSTKFTVECNFTGVEFSTEVIAVNDKITVVMTTSPRLKFLEFLLPLDVDAYLGITDINDYQDVYKLDVKVRSDDSQELASLISSFNQSISRADIDSVVQITSGIILEMAKKPPSETKSIKQTLLQNLNQIDMLSEHEAQQMSALIVALVHDPKSDSDPYQGQVATQICKKVADVHLQSTQNDSFPSTLTTKSQKSAATLMSCAETDTKENLEIMQSKPLTFDVTTPFPVLDIPVIDEEYPDYETDHSIFEKQKKYELASINSMEICKMSLEALSLTVAEGEETLTAESTNSSAQITKLVGTTLVKKEIEIRGAVLQPSRDFEDVEDAIDVMVCSWAYNPFWWSSFRRTILTNVLMVKFVKSGEEVNRFEKPNLVLLSLQHERQILRHQFEIGNNSIVRIDVKRGESFFVEFSNLSQSDSARVLITNFDKPEVLEVMTKGRVVTKSDNVVYQDEENGFDSWYYLSILPEADMGQPTCWVNIFTRSCYSWKISKKDWTFACKVSLTQPKTIINRSFQGSSNSNDEQIECLCTHLSILAGYVYNNPIKIDNVTTEPDFEMVLLNSFIVFITLSAIVSLYCLSILLTPFKKTPKTSIFLPADVSTSARYVYLVAIQTGNKRSSGTTSNICIKLLGTQNQSESHVLNYPDPHKKIFRRNNTDWFVVPTSHRLGELTQVALWSDYSGRNPSWFCTEVTVHDMQNNQKWYFDVNTWFNLPPQGRIYVEVQSTEETKKRRVLFPRVWPKRSYQNEFGSFVKMTLLLSIFVMMLGYCVVLSGLPSLTLKDGFAKFEKYKFDWSVVWVGFVSAVGTFVFHVIVVWLLRNGNKFPKRVTTMIWIFVATSVTMLIAVLTIFGFWVPTTNGYLWLTSVAVATIFYFFILENCYELWLNFHSRNKLTRQMNLTKLVLPIEAQRSHVFRKFGEYVLRPYFTHLYRPLSDEDIKEKRLSTQMNKRILALLEDTVMFACYVTLLYLAIFAYRNHLSTKNYNQMKSLLSGEQIRTDGYDSITSIDDIYQYINGTLIPTLHAHQWYGKFVVQEPGTMTDFHNKFLGVVRLRQRRVELHPCEDTSIVNQSCRSEFGFSQESYVYFGPEYNDLARLAHVWNYSTAREAGLSVYVGKFGIYYGGGFLTPLGRTRFNSFANLFYLKNNSWLDSATSVVLIEFLAYNVNTNLFSSVKIVLERSATGYTRSRLDLVVSQLLFIKNEESLGGLVIWLSFGTVVGIFTLKFLSRLWNEKLFFWKDLWTLVDLLIVGLTYATFFMYVHRAGTVKEFLDKLETVKKNEFIQYFELVREDISFTFVAAFLVFVATIRLWKTCSFATIFKVMEQTLVLAVGPILLVLVFHMTLLIAFTLGGYLLFNNISPNFKDIRDSLVTLILLMLGLQKNFSLKNLLESNPDIGKFFYAAYMLTNLFFLTVYICVIMIHYYEARLVSGEEFAKVLHFFSKQLSFVKTSVKLALVRLKAGSTRTRQLVTPKSDDIRYANCMTLSSNKLQLMVCIALKDLKTMRQEDKFELMQKVAISSQNVDKNDIFYRIDDERGSRIIHDDKIKRVAAAAEIVLTYGQKKRERRRKKYRKIMTHHLIKLDFISQILDTMLHVLSNIEIE